MPCNFDDNYFALQAHANEIILIANQSIPSVHAMLLVLKSVQEHHVTGQKHLVINRYQEETTGASLKDIRQILNVTQLHIIRDEPQAVSAAINKGVPLRKHDSQSHALADIVKLLPSILQGEAVVTAAHSGWLHSIRSFLGISKTKH